MPRRTQPNIIITGTPGVGKSRHCTHLASQTSLTHLSINDIVETHSLHEGWDDELKSWIVDEDKLLDEIETRVEAGGVIIDWHVCEVFPKRWVDLVVVLRANNTTLYDRLKGRGYGHRKLQENLDTEIMEEILSEARESYDREVVVELRSDEDEDVDANVERIQTWVTQWRKDHPEGVEG